MAKKRNKNTQMVDCMPKHSQQPRSSPPPKRRTDFSVFASTSPHPDSSPGSSSGEIRLSSVTASSLQERTTTGNLFSDDTLVRCSNYQHGKPVCSSESFDVPNVEVDSVVQDEGLAHSVNRDSCDEKNDIFKTSESAPRDSSDSDSSSLAVTLGSVVWARTAGQIWWPAEIMEERPALFDSVSDGHVLVQFYGNNPSAWVDPVTDISAFEDSFEERSNNPSKDFQEALKQALEKKTQLSSCLKLSPDGSAHSDQRERSSGKCTSASSSRTVDDFQERRRGQRKRKPKVHFDEATCSMKPETSARRLKIMRYLGLAPPVGSPF